MAQSDVASDGDIEPEFLPTPESLARASAFKGWKKLFLETLIKRRGHIGEACVAANVSRWTADKEKKDDEAFGRLWEEIVEGFIDSLERKGYDVALTGDARMLPYMLTALRRQKFGEKLDVNVNASLLVAAVAPTDVLRLVSAHYGIAGAEEVKQLPDSSQNVE